MISPSDTPIVQVQNLTCGYGGNPILSNVSFKLKPGEILALLGPNGSGKSTLLKTLTGSLSPIGGSITVQGKDLHSLRSRNRAQIIGFVPQDEEHSFGFTVREVVLMGRLPYAGSLFESNEDHKIAEQAMKLADCMNLQEKSVTEISGGERQRVLIARALAQTPSCLVLDEPNNHLDVRHVQDLRNILRKLAIDEGLAMITAVHDLNFASAVADKAIVVDAGKVQLMGEIKDVLSDGKVDEIYNVPFHRQELDGILRLLPIL